MENEQIFDIKVKYDDAIQKIAKLKVNIMSVKDEQGRLNKALKDGELEAQVYAEETEKLKLESDGYRDTIKDLEKAIKNQTKVEEEQKGSLKALRAELSNVTKQYDSLSRAEREGAKGDAMREHINKLTDEIKDAEEATQRYQRNVGNYKNSVEAALSGISQKMDEARNKYIELKEAKGADNSETIKAKEVYEEARKQFDYLNANLGDMTKRLTSLVGSINPMLGQMAQMAVGANSAGSALEVAKQGAVALGKQLLTLMANPVVAFLAVVAAAIMAVSKGIAGSEENTNRWNIAMARLKPILDTIANACTTFAAVILDVVEGAGKMIDVMAKLAESLPLVGERIKVVNEATRERIEIQKEQIRYEKESRDNIVASAERENEIAKLRDKVNQKDKYTLKERLAFLDKAILLEKQQAAERIRLAKLNLKNLEREAALSENDATMNRKLAEAKAAVIQVDTEYYNVTRRLHSQRSEIISAQQNEAKEAAKKRAEAAKKAAKNEKEILRQYQDELFSLIKDNIQKQIEAENVRYQREIEDLKERLATEKNLTVEARNTINAIIVQAEIKNVKNLDLIQKQADEARLKKEQDNINLRIQVARKGSEDEYAAKMDALDVQEQMELAKEQITQEQRILIQQKYDHQREQLEAEHQQRVSEMAVKAISDRYKTTIMQMQVDGDSELEILRQKEAEKQEILNALHQIEGETDDEFKQRRLQAELDYMNAKKDITNMENEIEQTKLEAAEKVTNGLVSLTSALGQSNKDFAKISKVLSLAEVAINTGKAISAGVAQAQSVPFPANIAAIATTVATVMANMATAITTIKSAKFATGGYVSGEGTSTSDSISAQLSNGESVINARSTEMFAPLLSAVNQAGGGVPINVAASSTQTDGENMLANAVAKGMSSIRPVVSVEEITDVANRVQALERIGNI